MAKSMMTALLCAIAIFAVACGGGNNSAKANGSNTATGNGGGDSAAAASDPYALYKNKGRNWTVKNVTKIAGMDDNISHMKTEVVELAEDHAMIKVWMLDKDMKPMAGMPEPEATKIEFKKVETTAPAGDAPKVDVKEETVEVKAGKFECTVTEMSGTKTWMSKEFPGLMVKMEHGSGSGELVEWNK